MADGVPKHLDMVLSLVPGEPAAGKGVTSLARGLMPGSKVVLELHSDPVVLQSVDADAKGEANFGAALPSGVEPGVHMLVLKGTTPAGAPVSSVAAFIVDAAGVVDSVTAASERMSSALPSKNEVLRAAKSGKSLYDVNANVGTVAAAAAAASVLAAAVGSGAGAAGGGRRGGSSSGGGSDGGDGGEQTESSSDGGSPTDVAGLEADSLAGVHAEEQGWGDRRRSWALPGAAGWQGFLVRALSATERRSVVLVRVLCDGQWIRAAFGSVDAVVCVGGAAAGFVAARDTGLSALTPAWWLMIVMILVSMANALAGLVAALAFTASVLVAGNVATIFDVRTLLGMIVLIMGLPLLGNSIRPLRRNIGGRTDVYDRIADYLIMPLFLSYAASAMSLALNGLSGLQLTTQSDADGLRWVVFVAAVVRLLAEDVVLRLYPSRCREVTLHPATEPGTGVKIATQGFRVAILVLVTVPFYGAGWRTWLLIGLSVLVPLAGVFTDRLPDFSTARRWIPRGILRTVVMMFVCSWFGAWVMGFASDPVHTRSVAILLLLPGIVVGLVDLLARTGGEWPDRWWKRAGGTALWSFAALVLTGMVAV